MLTKDQTEQASVTEPQTAGDAPAIAEGNTGTLPASFTEAIAADHSTYRAANDCLWFGQVAFAAGSPVSSSHPGVPQWLADGSIVDTSTASVPGA